MPQPASILIPCYNAEAHLAQCLESAIANDPGEIILLDDGSTDGSLAIAQNYASQIQVVTRANKGAQATRNELFALSTQNWIQYLDADDWLEPNKIAAQLAHQENADVLYCDFTIERWLNGSEKMNEFWQVDSDFVKAIVLFENPGQSNCFLYRRDRLSSVQWDDSTTYQSGSSTQKLCLDLLKVGAAFKHVAINGFTYRRGWSEAQITDPSKMAARLAARSIFQAALIDWVETHYPDRYKEEISMVQKRFAHECQMAKVAV